MTENAAITVTHSCGHEQTHDHLPASDAAWYAAQICSDCRRAQPAQRLGWSRASQERRPRRSHPLGTVVETGDGYTVYEDTTFGGGRVQIWDQS